MATTHTVHMGGTDNVFTPQFQTITVGDTVLWVNDDQDEFHTATSNGHAVNGVVRPCTPKSDEDFDSGQVGPGSTFPHTFNKKGCFNYHCENHTDSQTCQGMVGIIMVGENPVPA
jgi:plastocyanin